MALSLQEILDSGLLELYVIGELNQEDTQLVESALATYPELKKEILGIELSYELYGKVHAIDPSPKVLDQVLNEINGKTIELPEFKQKTSLKYLWPIVFTLGLLGAFALVMKNKSELTKTKSLLELCISEEANKSAQLAIFEQLKDNNNIIVSADATEKYPNTKIYLHNNNVDKKAYLQVQSLPELASDKSFQLWSLKDGVDPIPLDVFSDKADLFEIQYELNSNAYAITIEPKGGSKIPNLEELIGIFPLSS